MDGGDPAFFTRAGKLCQLRFAHCPVEVLPIGR